MCTWSYSAESVSCLKPSLTSTSLQEWAGCSFTVSARFVWWFPLNAHSSRWIRRRWTGTDVTTLAEERENLNCTVNMMPLCPGKSVTPPSSIIGKRVSPAGRRSVPLFGQIKFIWSLIILPAVTLAACRTRDKVMNAVTVESISHLFVFHLVDHLCISMVERPQVSKTFGRLQVILKDVPSTIPNDDGSCPTKKP